MNRNTTAYDAPERSDRRILWPIFALMALGLAGAGLGAFAWTRPVALAQTSPEATAVRPSDPPVPTTPPVSTGLASADIEKLVKSLKDAEDQRRQEVRKAAERIAELERQAASRLEETNRRAEEERRRTEEAAQQRAIAAEEQRRIDARRVEADRLQAEEQARLRAEEQARIQATLDAARRFEADRLAEEQRRAAWALEQERRRIEAERRRLEERRAIGPQVTGVGFWADRSAVRGPLPQTLTFSGWITADGPTTVRYRFRRSDGTVGPVQTLTFARAGRQSVSTTWSLGIAYTGWMSLEVLDPNPVTSTRAAFSVGP
jgi:hypothetical protein